MLNREDIPTDVPVEVQLVLAHLKPEPEGLMLERERLLAQLDAQLEPAQGALRELLSMVRSVLLSLRPDAPFNARMAAQFTEALGTYMKDPTASKPPPQVVHDCMVYLREHVTATGVGPLLAAVVEVREEKDRQRQQDLQTRIRLGSTRG
jgi:hypothetical protein